MPGGYTKATHALRTAGWWRVGKPGSAPSGERRCSTRAKPFQSITGYPGWPDRLLASMQFTYARCPSPPSPAARGLPAPLPVGAIRRHTDGAPARDPPRATPLLPVAGGGWEVNRYGDVDSAIAAPPPGGGRLGEGQCREPWRMCKVLLLAYIQWQRSCVGEVCAKYWKSICTLRDEY